jgi:two-component system phosphate regulon sensor histidine kinase PhoR
MPVAVPLRFRLFLSCFLVIGCIALAIGLAEAWGAVWVRLALGLVLSLLGAAAMTGLFSRALAWRVRRLGEFADHVLDSHDADPPLPDEGEETAVLNQSFRRMAQRIRELVDNLSLESQRTDAILRTMTEGVLAVDHQMRVMFSNQAFAQAVSLKGPVEQNTPVFGVVRDPAFLAMLGTVLSTGQPASGKLQFSTGEDSAIFEAHITPLPVPPQNQGALAILHNITGLERLERIRRDFVANVSHEMRTPLTAIRGYAETLLSGALEDEENNRRFVEIIQAHAIRLNNIASDLLTLSDLESGRKEKEAEPGPVSVEDAIHTALQTVETEARLRGVKLVGGEMRDSVITGHTIRLEQALVNLLDNAIKFNKPGGEARIASSIDEEGRAVITVSDTGRGIPSQDIPRIFERFYRVDKARSREVGGTGLGLSIVRHAVERMEGTIRVESQLGKGTVFTLTFPVRKDSVAA